MAIILLQCPLPVPKFLKLLIGSTRLGTPGREMKLKNIVGGGGEREAASSKSSRSKYITSYSGKGKHDLLVNYKPGRPNMSPSSDLMIRTIEPGE